MCTRRSTATSAAHSTPRSSAVTAPARSTPCPRTRRCSSCATCWPSAASRRGGANDKRRRDLARRRAPDIAPIQVMQQRAGANGRRSALETDRRHLEAGARFAIALANPYEGIDDSDWVPPYPDMLDVDGVVYASTPLAVRRDGE